MYEAERCGGSTPGLSLRIYLPDREHAADLSRDCPHYSGHLLHPHLARNHSARGWHSRVVGRRDGAGRDGLRGGPIDRFAVRKTEGDLEGS